MSAETYPSNQYNNLSGNDLREALGYATELAAKKAREFGGKVLGLLKLNRGGVSRPNTVQSPAQPKMAVTIPGPELIGGRPNTAAANQPNIMHTIPGADYVIGGEEPKARPERTVNPVGGTIGGAPEAGPEPAQVPTSGNVIGAEPDPQHTRVVNKPGGMIQ